ncbi:hypothetical protein DM01DRAFT_1338712 [Hesseltinella vesiculosa]|uniref:Uncharacterized protein n=1 Tax=Hesseltinella vesiculosa TaxID=101127 RepID=A0A1X2G982_9FUNG|nr:hypothetical protein DM01DRAFT_1338712 [Hesseltinella vesiculosa]
MTHKHAFEPKDARIMSYYEDDEINDELTELNSQPRRKKTTGTQALADFLSNTSPEEFQRSTQAEPSSTNFFKIRKGKRLNPPANSSSSSVSLRPSLMARNTKPQPAPPPAPPSSPSAISYATGSTAYTIPRKNYIEIIPKFPPTPVTNAPPPPYPAISPRGPVATAGSDHSLLPTSPMLPSHHRRDSSLYSGSLRHSASIKSQRSSRTNRPSVLHDTFQPGPTTSQKQPEPEPAALQQALLSKLDNMDIIVAALSQRLERCQLANRPIPSDVVAKVLGEEHVRALSISFQQEQLDLDEDAENAKRQKRGNVRHVQVQTMPIQDPSAFLLSQHKDKKNIGLGLITDLPSPTNDHDDDPLALLPDLPSPHHDQSPPLPSSSSIADSSLISPASSSGSTIEALERQLAEERKQRLRLQASLDNTRDHFEVLSGLAYKKLRELWEERLRWENACMELSQQVLALQQEKEDADASIEASPCASQPSLNQENHMDVVSLTS